MSAVLRELVASPLAETHRLEVIATHRPVSVAGRVLIFMGALARLVVFCLRSGPRIVHIHTALGGSLYRKAICVVVARALGRPVVLHVHTGAVELAAFDDRLGPRRRAVIRWALQQASRIISVSTACAREVESRFALGPIEVMPNPAPAPVTVGLPRRPALPGHAQVLYVGGFQDPVKGVDVLLRALPLLRDRAPDVRVTLAGPGEPKAALGPLGDTVQWVGWLDERAKSVALRESDIFVLPSTSEGLPMALLEAMAHGLAIVASSVGGVPDVVTAGVEGLLVPAGDAVALADAVAALAEDPERARALGCAAQQRAAQLGLDALAARLEGMYRELAR
jgi:glycosyltransferase involved in cell wall biosynthesis